MVGDVRRQQLNAPPAVQIYVPLTQLSEAVTERALLARVSENVEREIPFLRGIAREVAPHLYSPCVFGTQSIIDRETRPWRTGAALFGALGIMASLVAVIGLYSAVAYNVSLWRREFAVRMAIGAAPKRVA